MEPHAFDASLVWQRLLGDRTFLADFPDEDTRAVYRELVDRLPDVLGDLMDLPVSADTRHEARLRVLRYAISTELYQRVIRVDRRHAGNPEVAAQVIGGVFRTMLKEMEQNPTATLEEFLGDEARAASRDGTLTVAGLLAIQPQAILGFTSH